MKIYGLDIETLPSWEFRTLQIYDPAKDITGIYHWNPKYNPAVVRKYIMRGAEGSEEIVRSGEEFPLEAMLKFVANPENGFITHSGYFDSYIMQKNFKTDVNITGDSFVLASLIPSPQSTRRSLDALMKKNVDEDYDKFAHGSWDMFDWDEIELPDAALLYCARDAKACYVLEAELVATYGRYANALYKLECRLIPVLAQMRAAGIRVDLPALEKGIDLLREERDNLSKEIDSLAGFHVRPTSNKEIARYLFEVVGLTPIVLTGTGAPSTSEEALEALEHEATEAIRRFKSLDNMVRSMEKIKEVPQTEWHEKFAIFRPEFKPISRSTSGGRIYTKGPSVNQWNWNLRACVVPCNPENEFYYGDIVAGELMVVAYAANCRSLIEAYEAGADIHRQVASRLFGVPEDQVTDSQRESTKVVEFATIYGSKGAAVARQLRIPINEAEKWVEDFMDRYPEIRHLRNGVHKQVMASGLVKTMFGRYRRVSEAFSPDVKVQEKGQRKAFNFFAQSGLADLQKLVMVNFSSVMPAGVSLRFTVFDSFLIEKPKDVPKEAIDEALTKLLTFKFQDITMKLRHKAGIGQTWREAKENA